MQVQLQNVTISQIGRLVTMSGSELVSLSVSANIISYCIHTNFLLGENIPMSSSILPQVMKSLFRTIGQWNAWSLSCNLNNACIQAQPCNDTAVQPGSK